MSVRFHSRVALVTTEGFPLRHLPCALAAAMVDAGSAAIRPSTGRVREIVLTRPASAFAERVGPAGGSPLGGTRFWRWTRLNESGTRVIEHHPRALYRAQT
jgi:hypothetical protein